MEVKELMDYYEEYKKLYPEQPTFKEWLLDKLRLKI